MIASANAHPSGRRHRCRTTLRGVLAGAGFGLLLAVAAPSASGDASDASGPITYRTLFQDPGATPRQDLSLENHAIGLIHATPSGERITFAYRDFNRAPVGDALIAAHKRGVDVQGVIDGSERDRQVVQQLLAALGPDRVVVCGTPTFALESCIATGHPVLSPKSLMHNKFMTFSRLDDGRTAVILQTSKNFFAPNQLHYYNDMVEITGDAALHEAYVQYVVDMKAQVRADNRYDGFIRAGDNGRNTIFPSPRPQPDLDTDDTIVDRMDEIDCSEGGAASGNGLVRVANMAFRTERAVIMRKLVALKRAGCDIEVILSNADGNILARLVSAGIPVHPFFIRATSSSPQVIVHTKFWLVDAKSTVTGRRTKLVYAGSSNWRGDQQYTDDLLLRIEDDGVHAAYSAYWDLVRSRAVSVQNRPPDESVAPSAALTAAPAANAAGWNRSTVTVRIAASDGHNVRASGLKRLHVEMSGAQSGSWDFAGETAGYNVRELEISAEGETTVTYFAEDARGNVSSAGSHVVRIDRTAPAVSGLPQACRLWPPDNRMVHVADVGGDDTGGSGLADLLVSARSDDAGDEGDIAISGGSVDLRAEKAARGGMRTYTITAGATDVAGNAGAATATCTVPHSQGGSD